MTGKKGQQWTKDREPSKTQIGARVSIDIKNHISQIAKKYKRTESQVIAFLLEDILNKTDDYIDRLMR